MHDFAEPQKLLKTLRSIDVTRYKKPRSHKLQYWKSGTQDYAKFVRATGLKAGNCDV